MIVLLMYVYIDETYILYIFYIFDLAKLVFKNELSLNRKCFAYVCIHTYITYALCIFIFDKPILFS